MKAKDLKKGQLFSLANQFFNHPDRAYVITDAPVLSGKRICLLVKPEHAEKTSQPSAMNLLVSEHVITFSRDGKPMVKVGDVRYVRQYSWPLGVTKFTVIKDLGTQEYGHDSGKLMQMVEVESADGFKQNIWANQLFKTLKEAFNEE